MDILDCIMDGSNMGIVVLQLSVWIHYFTFMRIATEFMVMVKCITNLIDSVIL